MWTRVLVPRVVRLCRNFHTHRNGALKDQSSHRTETPLSHEEVVKIFREQGVITDDLVYQTCLRINPRSFINNNHNIAPSAQNDPVVMTPKNSMNEDDAHAAQELSALGLMVTFACLDILKDGLRTGMTAMDLGCGAGYVAACMANMIGKNGTLVAVDRDPACIELARDCIGTHYPDLLSRIHFVQGDAYKGYGLKAPYDAIHVGGAVRGVPQVWFNQLRWGGLMTVPIISSEEARQEPSSSSFDCNIHSPITWQPSALISGEDQILYRLYKGHEQRIIEAPVMQVNFEPFTS
eukprot:TRINITY_DN13765_c0_g1_i2.p1 TRINITY_DN13765_c0_g1~~TRINITY_DN13765_c0_g1_i2.p1  ORF type:complete len:293 (+),score=48.86 TRINITY_DN13765_c0_g1_i2:24-902(+)